MLVAVGEPEPVWVGHTAQDSDRIVVLMCARVLVDENGVGRVIAHREPAAVVAECHPVGEIQPPAGDHLTARLRAI